MSASVLCRRRGCGQSYNPENNNEDVCCHHPGLPFFHDAYKGWSCCNKKSVDFTEFLNIKGCTFGKHTIEAPPELPKSKVDKETAHIPVEVTAPKPKDTLQRPPFDSPLKTIEPIVAASLKNKFINCTNDIKHEQLQNDDEIILGTKCKHGGCGASYDGPESDSETCVHHPGVPIFHEGMKYWSCCQKKTTDFSVFLQQVGCTRGSHKWKGEVQASNTVKCRWDWHQTASHVVVTVYAKEYNPTTSWVKLNPIRLSLQLEFPKESGAKFDLDLELRGVIKVEETAVEMFGTKVEIKMPKAEPGSWSKLDIPKPVEPVAKKEKPKAPVDDDNDVDLDDITPIDHMNRVNITEI